MTRIVVIGGSGFFGALIADRLRAAGYRPWIAGRRRGELLVDVENADSLRRTLQQGDLVIDTAGPFQRRSDLLLRVALERRFDVIDISDSPAYASKVFALEEEIRASGIRVLTACSALSTVSAAVMKASGIEKPRRLTTILTPASRYTANPATVASMLSSLSSERSNRGVRAEGVDAVTLPRIWPTLSEVEFIVDAGIPGANRLLYLAARWPRFRRLLQRASPMAIWITRRIGPRRGRMNFEIESDDRVVRYSFTGERSYLLAVMPAVLAAQAIAQSRLRQVGVIPQDQQVNPHQLFDALKRQGIEISIES